MISTRRIIRIPKEIHNFILPSSQSQRGFTLIELLIVFSVIAFLTTVGLASFLVYNRFQILNTSAQGLVTTLNIAKIRAASQVKQQSGACSISGDTIQGYRVHITAGGATGINNYQLFLVCSLGSYPIGGSTPITFPAGVYISNTPPPSSDIYFHVLSGIVEGAGAFQVSDVWGNKKIINVSTLGNISTN